MRRCLQSFGLSPRTGQRNWDTEGLEATEAASVGVHKLKLNIYNLAVVPECLGELVHLEVLPFPTF